MPIWCVHVPQAIAAKIYMLLLQIAIATDNCIIRFSFDFTLRAANLSFRIYGLPLKQGKVLYKKKDF